MGNKQVVTLEDLEIRYKNILEKYPKRKRCSVIGCNNPRDRTPLLGEDVCCAYHRLLFDFWCSEAMDNDKLHYYLKNQRARRIAFTKWRNKIGKEACDNIALKLMQEPINWEC